MIKLLSVLIIKKILLIERFERIVRINSEIYVKQ